MITTLRWGSSPVLSVVTAGWPRSSMCTTRRSLEGMGCVASAIQVQDGTARIAHVGDTRVYLAGSAGCEQLTCDHTLAASLRERPILQRFFCGRYHTLPLSV